MFNNLFGPNYDTAQITAEYSQRIASVLELDELALAAGAVLSEPLQASRVALLVFTEEKDGVRAEVFSGAGRVPTLPHKFPREAAIFPAFAQATQPILYSSLGPSLAEAQRAWFAKLGLLVYAPILEGRTVTAALAVGARKNKERFGTRELDLLWLIARQTSVALKNARLVSHLRALNKEMQALNETLVASNERMKDMDKVKTDFITITSHELRTPLTQIIGFSDLLNMMSEDESVSGAQLREVTDSMIKSCNRLNEVVTQMLDVSQTDVDALRLKFVETDMETVLRGAVEPFAAAINERKLAFTVQRVRGLPRFSGDPKRLSQGLGQVIGNAIKYTPDGGHIDVSFKYIARDLERGESIEIIISDSGVGINPKHLESIFDKFFRVGSAALHSTGTTKFMGGGPGLGLAIAKGIIEGHGGKVWAESPGYDMKKLPGTQIHIILPIKPAPFATKASSSAFIGLDANGNLPDIKV